MYLYERNKVLRKQLNWYIKLIIVLSLVCSVQAILLIKGSAELSHSKLELEQAVAMAEESEYLAKHALMQLDVYKSQTDCSVKAKETCSEHSLIVTATAYCPCEHCCGIYSAEHVTHAGKEFVQKTATGTIPQQGRTIAVDPSVIPLGSKVKIGDTVYTAEDTGAAIKGNRIDIFFESHKEALDWGRQTVEAIVYENNKL